MSFPHIYFNPTINFFFICAYLLLISIIICFEFVFESVIVNYTFRIHVHIFADLFSNSDIYLCNFVSISIQLKTNQNIIRTIHFKSVSFAIFHGATNSSSHFFV